MIRLPVLVLLSTLLLVACASSSRMETRGNSATTIPAGSQMSDAAIATQARLPTPQPLSIYQIRQQIEWSFGGGADGNAVSFCENHVDRDKWLTVGVTDLYDKNGRYTYPPFASSVNLCVHFMREPGDGSLVELVATLPDGSLDQVQFIYGQATDNPDLISPTDLIERNFGPYSGRGDVRVVYHRPLGAPVGLYQFALRINGQEIANGSINFGACECPVSQVAVNGQELTLESASTYRGEAGDRLTIDLTGYPPNQELLLEIIGFDLVPHRIPGGTSPVRYSWRMRSDDHGQAVTQLLLDQPLSDEFAALIVSAEDHSRFKNEYPCLGDRLFRGRWCAGEGMYIKGYYQNFAPDTPFGCDESARDNAEPLIDLAGATQAPTDRVRFIQQRLLDLGYKLPQYGADGAFGQETERAIRTFQRRNRLEVDGVVGPVTWACLKDTEALPNAPGL